ncbi:MFS general substrate transporter [Thozetella sp. PMI_491]|nr:MFS general substrate transporter [Thozetella sp. PMI_491]
MKDKKTPVDVATDTPLESDPENGEVQVYSDLELERRTLRKFDWFVMPQLMLMILINNLDRSNIGVSAGLFRNAKVFGFEEGLGLHGTQFNDVSTVFYAGYVVFEVPWVMCVKRFGARNVLAVAIVCWSIITLATGFAKNYGHALALRVLLGASESGIFPSCTFIISTIFDRTSQAKRVCLLYMSNALAGAFGGLIAYGIQNMGEARGLAAWRWLFVVEGAVSFVICGIAWFTLPSTAENAWFLNEDERAVMRARKERNAAYSGTDKFEWKIARKGLTDPYIYAGTVLFFCSSIAIFGFSTFLPTLLTGMGYSGLAANYMSIPCYIFASIMLVIWTSISDRLGKRALCAFIAPIPCILGYAITVGTANSVAGYVAMFLCAGGIYPYNALMLTWITNNLAPDYKRSVGMPLFASLGNISGVVASQIYPSSDSPRYLKGNAVSLACEAVACLGVGAIWWMLRRRDRKKEELIAQGIENNGYGDEDRGLNFRYTL